MLARSGGPTIGITVPSRVDDSSQQRRAARAIAHHRRALEAHGAQTVELPPGGAPVQTVELPPGGAPVQAGDLDGLVLTGGGDMDPRYYGARRHPQSRDIDRVRDELELGLCRLALAEGMPILGICRGAQVLGVALGGKLVQSIEAEIADALPHAGARGQGAVRHWVTLALGSRLREIMGAERIRVNSSHRQSNGPLGPSARRVAWSADEVIEGIEHTGTGLVVGVQWHPDSGTPSACGGALPGSAGCSRLSWRRPATMPAGANRT